MAKPFERFTSMSLFIPLLLFSIKFTTSTNNIEQVGPIGPAGRVFEADIDSLGPEELENVKNKIAEIVDGLTEYEKVAESAHFDNELMNDDPFVYDLQPHDDLPEQDKLSVRALINTWNKLVYSRDHLDGYGDQLEIQERSANKACSKPCHPYASCISGTCQCKKGFYKNQNEDCEDKNECLTPNICGKNQECLNLFGSYKCQCKTGFNADKNSKDLKCIDLDECREGIHQCDPEAKCINTEGFYKCLCELQSIDIKPQKKCPKPASILDCKPNKIEITITRVHFKKFVPAKNALEKNPAVKFLMFLQPNETMDMSDNCTLKLTNKSSLSYKFSILPPFNACSTVQTIDHSNTKTPSVIYRNTLWWSVLLPKLPFVIIPYKMYEIECKFPLRVNQFEKNATVVVQSFKNRTYKKDGQSKISMKFWRIPPSKSYSQPALSVPMEFEIGEVLYVTVELEKDGVLPDKSFIYLDHCYLSPTPQITKIRTDIVVNGCPSIINLKHGILNNGVSRVSTFYFQMVHFHGLGASLFIDCDIVVCERICKPNCPTNRKKRASLNETESLGENQIFFRPGNVQVTRMSSGPITAIQPVTIKKNTVEKEVKIIKSEVQDVRKTDETNVDNPAQPKTWKTQDKESDRSNSTKRLILPIMLIAANISILTLLGLLSYALARSVAIRRRAKRQKHDRDGLFEETLGHVLFSPPTELNKTPSGKGSVTEKKKFHATHSFCQDKNCQFMKDIKGKNHHLFGKSSKKKRQQLKESMFKPTVYGVSTLTCPTPFNSPPPSPPIRAGPAVTSIGTSPIRVYDENRNQSTIKKSIKSESK